MDDHWPSPLCWSWQQGSWTPLIMGRGDAWNPHSQGHVAIQCNTCLLSLSDHWCWDHIPGVSLCKKESQVKSKKMAFSHEKSRKSHKKKTFPWLFMTESHFFWLYLTFFFTESQSSPGLPVCRSSTTTWKISLLQLTKLCHICNKGNPDFLQCTCYKLKLDYYILLNYIHATTWIQNNIY